MLVILLLTWWLGLYLLVRDEDNPRLRWAGSGLTAYALALAIANIIFGRTTDSIRFETSQWLGILLIVPVVLWTAALIELLPRELALRDRLWRSWRYGQVPLALLWGVAAGVAVFANGVLPATLRVLLLLLLFSPMVTALIGVERYVGVPRSRSMLGLLIVAVLFFGLSVAAVLLPFHLIPTNWLMSGIGVDLVLMGVAIAWFDAFEQGEGLRLHALRSLAAAALAAALFGGPVGVTLLAVSDGAAAMRPLLIVVMAMAIAVQLLGDSMQTWLDRWLFSDQPQLQQEREQMRTATNELLKNDPALDLYTLDSAEFTRLTRRALSHFGDLPKLTASPLIHLPLIEQRLAHRPAPDNSLDRAAALKSILADAIERLKPSGPDDFGTSDEWRFYNALYFPYVVGVRPYSRRAEHSGLDPVAREALEWFRAQVPERTLYNWQNTAAELVAQYLRELMDADKQPHRVPEKR